MDSQSEEKNQKEKPNRKRKSPYSTGTRSLSLPSLTQDIDEEESDVDFFQRMLTDKKKTSPKRKSESYGLEKPRTVEELVKTEKEVIGGIWGDSPEEEKEVPALGKTTSGSSSPATLVSSKTELCEIEGKRKESEQCGPHAELQRHSTDLSKIINASENKETIFLGQVNPERSPKGNLRDVIDDITEKDEADSVPQDKGQVSEDPLVSMIEATGKEDTEEGETSSAVQGLTKDTNSTPLLSR